MSLVVFFLIVTLVASSGAVFKPGDWYRTLAKPAWTPPDWVFPLGWALLYALIAVSGWRVWERLQLALNAAWSAIFFGLKRPDWAFADVACLWLAILANILVFRQIDPLVAWLLLPYLGWVAFAGALNFAVWRRNPGTL